jgi:hypothetical protein
VILCVHCVAAENLTMSAALSFVKGPECYLETTDFRSIGNICYFDLLLL